MSLIVEARSTCKLVARAVNSYLYLVQCTYLWKFSAAYVQYLLFRGSRVKLKDDFLFFVIFILFSFLLPEVYIFLCCCFFLLLLLLLLLSILLLLFPPLLLLAPLPLLLPLLRLLLLVPWRAIEAAHISAVSSKEHQRTN